MAAFLFSEISVVATGRKGERSEYQPSPGSVVKCQAVRFRSIQIRSRKSLQDLCQKPTAQQLFLWQCARLIVAIAVWCVWWLPLVLGMC